MVYSLEAAQLSQFTRWSDWQTRVRALVLSRGWSKKMTSKTQLPGDCIREGWSNGVLQLVLRGIGMRPKFIPASVVFGDSEDALAAKIAANIEGMDEITLLAIGCDRRREYEWLSESYFGCEWRDTYAFRYAAERLDFWFGGGDSLYSEGLCLAWENFYWKLEAYLEPIGETDFYDWLKSGWEKPYMVFDELDWPKYFEKYGEEVHVSKDFKYYPCKILRYRWEMAIEDVSFERAFSGYKEVVRDSLKLNSHIQAVAEYMAWHEYSAAISGNPWDQYGFDEAYAAAFDWIAETMPHPEMIKPWISIKRGAELIAQKERGQRKLKVKASSSEKQAKKQRQAEKRLGAAPKFTWAPFA